MKKKRKIKRSLPNPDTLSLNMRQVLDMNVFPLTTAFVNSIHTKDVQEIREEDIGTFQTYEIKRLCSRPRGLFRRFGDK